MDMILCPHCGKHIEITKALIHEVEEQVLAKERKKHQEELEELKRKITAESSKQLLEQIKSLQEENEKKNKQLEEAVKNELTLRKQKNELEEERRLFELEKQRQLDNEREKIRQKTFEEVTEQQRLKDKEKDKVIEDLKKSLEEAQRKANQGSQQLQGEVLELDFEETLRMQFPDDVIEPIGKGVLGADIRQIVKSPKGVACGTILWEFKRTKVWSDGWIMKLKNDALTDKANIPAIVSEALPEEARNGLGVKDKVWICGIQLVVPLAMLLRKSLLDETRQKLVSQFQKDKAGLLYEYITSHEFQQQVEAMVATYKEMQAQIQKERIAYEKFWKTREMQVTRLLTGVAGIYGSVQGIAGPALPTVKNLNLLEEQDAV